MFMIRLKEIQIMELLQVRHLMIFPMIGFALFVESGRMSLKSSNKKELLKIETITDTIQNKAEQDSL